MADRRTTIVGARRRIAVVLTILAAIALFALDLPFPATLASGVAYVVVVMLAIWLHDPGFVIATAAFSTGLVILAAAFPPFPEPLWLRVINPALGLLAIWASAIVGVRLLAAQDALRRGREFYRLSLEELEHRVKNNFAALAALAAISGDHAATAEQLARDMQARIRAMSTVHSLLSVGSARVVDLAGLAAAMIPPHRAASVTLAGPPVSIGPRQGTALGMVLQELTTNSLKYGALASDRGRVEFRWRPEPAAHDAESRRIVMTWRETGGPPIPSPPTPGLGTTLITGFVTSELGGAVEFGYPPEGASHRIDIALDRA